LTYIKQYRRNHCPLRQHYGHTILKLNYKSLKKNNRNPKLLGVTLDEKLNFGQHILNIERKAGNSLGMLRRQGTVASIFWWRKINNNLIQSFCHIT
jgi:hypothetical protein